MLKTLKINTSSKVIKKESSVRTNIDFALIDDLIYYIKNNNSQIEFETSRLIISTNCEKKIFAMTHDDCNHLEHHRVYVKLVEFVYIFRMSRKLRLYI